MGLDSREARYASMIEGMDQSLGDLMDYLVENNLMENTIILFMSDNGGLSALGRGGEPHTHNWPLNSGKGSAYEGGIRVPMIVSWPGKIQAGSKSEEILVIEDFFPTILEMAGIKEYQTVQEIDGISFVPALTGQITTDPDRNLIWHFPNKWGANGPGIGSTSSIRKGDWKLVYWHKTQSMELFNLQEDLMEKTNLANQRPEKLKELAKELGNYLRTVKAQMPSFRDSEKQVPWPDEVLNTL